MQMPPEIAQLEALIRAANEAEHGFVPKVSPNTVRACRAALDMVLPALVVHSDARVRNLALQAWDSTKKLSPKGLKRLAAYLEQNPL